MAGEKDRVDAYIDTIGRMEPDIAMIDNGAGIASIAISLKRIADSLDKIANKMPGQDVGHGIVTFGGGRK